MISKDEIIAVADETGLTPLCVDLDYTDNTGRRSNRVIEPYSLRQAQNGNILRKYSACVEILQKPRSVNV